MILILTNNYGLLIVKLILKAYALVIAVIVK